MTMNTMNNTQLPPLPLKNGVLEIDNTFIESLTACPRKLEYNKLLKRIPSSDAPALNFGSAIHAALEYRYKIYKNEPPGFMEDQDILDKILLPYFEKNKQQEDEHRNCQFAHEIMCEYNKRYKYEPFSLLLDEKGEVLTELSFAMPLFSFKLNDLGILDEEQAKIVKANGHTILVVYTGRIDLPTLWDNLIIIVDHKTAGTLGTFYFDGKKVSPQFEGYCWAFEQLTGKTVNGFCINVIRTKPKPGTTRNGWDKWWDETFGRHKEYLRPNQLNEWKFNTIKLVEEFFYHYSQNYMPQKKLGCTMYGKCPYYGVCYLPPEQRLQMLRSDLFQANEWSPLK